MVEEYNVRSQKAGDYTKYSVVRRHPGGQITNVDAYAPVMQGEPFAERVVNITPQGIRVNENEIFAKTAAFLATQNAPKLRVGLNSLHDPHEGGAQSVPNARKSGITLQ